jgi:predicted RecA/RadA family phage recombinase
VKRLLSILAALICALAPIPAKAAGEVVIVTAPWTVSVGDPVIVGGFTGIAAQGVSSGAQLRLRREGVYTVAKVAGSAWTVGDALYYAQGDTGLSKTSASKTFMGFASASASSGATSGSIVLVPAPSFASIETALDALTATVAGFATTFTTGNLTADNVTVDDTLVAGNATIASVDFASFWDEMMTFETSAGGRLDALEAQSGSTADLRTIAELFGDGSDGNLTCSSSTITSGPLTSGALTRTAYYQNVTVQSGCQILANGYPLYASGTADLTAAPAVWLVEPTPAASANGNAGGYNTNAAGGTATAVAFTASDLLLPTAGTNGASSANTGQQASGPSAAIWLGYPGGTGGAGGTGSTGGGGASRVPAVHTTRRWLIPWRPISPIAANSVRPASSGAGGGSGGPGPCCWNQGSSGGGGGLAGYTLVFHAYELLTGGSTASGMFRATGGAGGNGANGYANDGAGGGGGGGGGGMIEVAYWSRTGSAVSNAFSSTGGQGGAGGAAGGGPGPGSDGTGGHGGLVVVCNAQTGACTNTLNTTPASGRTGGSTSASL